MALTLIKTLTASSSATLEFVDGTSDVVFDNTYSAYEFHYVSMHPATASEFLFQVNATDDAGGSYDQSLITNTFYRAELAESGSSGNVQYSAGNDQAQSADYCKLIQSVDDEAYDSCSGILTLFNPSSTTFIKCFMARTNATHHSAEYTMDAFCQGYINDTTAIDEISFKFTSGNIDAGTIKMFGVS